MAAVLVDMGGLDGLAVALDASLELVQPMLGEEGVIAVGGNAQGGGDAVFAEDQFVEGLAGLDDSTHANGRSDAIEDSFGDFFGMVQCVVQPTPALLAVIVTVIMAVLVMSVFVAMFVAVLVTVLGVAVAVIVTMSIQLEQDGAHHGIRAGVQSQGVVARVEMEGAAPFEGQ